MLINQYEVQVEQYTKTEESQWLFREYETEDARMTFSSIGMDMAIADIYEGVDFNFSY